MRVKSIFYIFLSLALSFNHLYLSAWDRGLSIRSIKFTYLKKSAVLRSGRGGVLPLPPKVNLVSWCAPIIGVGGGRADVPSALLLATCPWPMEVPIVALGLPSCWSASSFEREQRLDGPATSVPQSGDVGDVTGSGNGGVVWFTGAATEMGDVGDAGDEVRLPVAMSSECPARWMGDDCDGAVAGGDISAGTSIRSKLSSGCSPSVVVTWRRNRVSTILLWIIDMYYVDFFIFYLNSKIYKKKHKCIYREFDEQYFMF